jgi:hypothetical protein
MRTLLYNVQSSPGAQPAPYLIVVGGSFRGVSPEERGGTV